MTIGEAFGAFVNDPDLADPHWLPGVVERVLVKHRSTIEAAIRAEGLDALRRIEGECGEWIEYQHGEPSRIIDRISAIAIDALREADG